jgi:aspartyl-tRNA(Asn)/glutamyl-tRNA(Gln) amidotransferase subunit A
MQTVIETAQAVRGGERKAVDVLEACLAAIATRNGLLNAFVVVDEELAHREAARVDDAIARGDDPGPLAGVPFGVKDLEDCGGLPTSHGSLWYRDRPPVPNDSVHVARLRAAGAVPVGKTAAPEFGTVAFTHTKAWGTTRNPWDASRTPGGSSGGSAAAVAAGMVPFCTSSDGGGSTRIPAAFTGLVGLKASYGRVPHPHAGISQTTSLGALVTTVADAARHLDVVAGPDDRDRLSLPASGVTYERVIDDLPVAGLRVAWSLDLGFATVDREVEELATNAADALIAAASLTRVDRGVQLTDPLRTWMSMSSVDLWIGLADGLWPERSDELMGFVRRDFERSEQTTLPRLGRRFGYRHRLEAEVAEMFAAIDVLVTPTTAVTAFAADGPGRLEVDGRELDPGMAVPFTMLANLCHNPAISVPAGVTSSGLPVGLQIVARRHRDDIVLRLARILEQTRPWPRLAPFAYA